MIKDIVDKLLCVCGGECVCYDNYRFTVSRSAVEDADRSLRLRISEMIEQAVSDNFLAFMNEEDILDAFIADEDDPAIDEYRSRYIALVTDNDCAELVARFPAIIEMTLDVRRGFDGYMDEMLSRLDTSYEDVCSTLLKGKRFSSVTGISSDSGDVHNHGRSTTLIKTDEGTVVYKPHDVRIDLYSHDLIMKFFSDFMTAPRVCAYEEHGFVEFIENTSASTEEDARRYFYNLGGLVAVVQTMGCTDLHHNNILASGIYPVIIDYELFIVPNFRNIEEGFVQDLRYSLYFSNFMPLRRGNVELSILFGEDDQNRSAPVVNGKRLTINDHPDEFMNGFRDIYSRCIEKREEIKAQVRLMSGIKIRHIYRGTRIYAELVKYASKLALRGVKDLRSILYDKLALALKRSSSVDGEAVATAELESILRGDIPYVYTFTDSCDLYIDGKVVLPDFFRVNSIDNVISRTDHLGEKDLAFEEALLTKAMTRVIRRTETEGNDGIPVTETLDISSEELLSKAESIFTAVADDALTTPSGSLCWFGPNYFLESGMFILTSGFIDGNTGLAVFFAAIHKMSKDEKIRKRAGDLVEHIMGKIESYVDSLAELDVIYPNTESVSLISGLTGKIFASHLVAGYMGDDRYYDLCKKMIGLFDKMDIGFERNDIYAGLAGLLKLLCKYDDLYSLDGVPQICEKLADRIIATATIPFNGKFIWRTLSQNWAISGSGHGQSGIAVALYTAGKRLGRQDYIDAASAGFEFEDKIYSTKIGAWPDRRKGENTDQFLTGYCSGAPGIGLNALETDYPGSEDILERAISSTMSQPLSYKDFLCCGNCASIDFLLTAGDKLGRADLTEQARTRMAMIVSRADKNGHFNCVNINLKDVFAPSLYYGVSGIGYEMLRMINPDDIESVLL